MDSYLKEKSFSESHKSASMHQCWSARSLAWRASVKNGEKKNWDQVHLSAQMSGGNFSSMLREFGMDKKRIWEWNKKHYC